MGLARHESEFEAAGETSLDVRELLQVLGNAAAGDPGKRSEAIANFLSGAEGWRDAATRLGGAFAASLAPTGLTDSKE